MSLRLRLYPLPHLLGSSFFNGVLILHGSLEVNSLFKSSWVRLGLLLRGPLNYLKMQ